VLISHVRTTSKGGVAHRNTHPLVRELFGAHCHDVSVCQGDHALLTIVLKRGIPRYVTVMVSREDYKDSIDKFVGIIERELADKVVAVYAAGSFARGDYIVGRSDIDLYIVVKEEEEGLKKKLYEICKEIEDKNLKEVKNYHPEPLSLAITTMDEVKDGKSWLGMGWEYHIFLREGRLLYGTDIKEFIQRPSRENEILLARRVLEDFKSGHEIYRLFSLVFRTTSIFLSLSAIYVAAKEDVVKEFKKAYPNEKDAVKALERAYELWNLWAKRELTDEEVLEVFNAALKMSNTISRLLKMEETGVHT